MEQDKPKGAPLGTNPSENAISSPKSSPQAAGNCAPTQFGRATTAPKAKTPRTPGATGKLAVAKIKNKKKARIRRWERVGLSLIAALSLLVILALGFMMIGPGPASKDGHPSVFTVVPGDGAASVARRLDDANIVRSRTMFRLIAQVTGASRHLRPGDYAIPSAANPAQIAAILGGTDPITHSITIPEGWSVALIMARLEASPYLTGPMPPAPAEGSLMPDTYHIGRGETRAAMLARMAKAHQDFMESVWLNRSPDLPFSTMTEAVTLASVVEKETGLASERPHVASVFVNRLRRGMKLQSDPTIIYGITHGRPLRRKILASEIRAPHPWNTYVINGLPQTPIANPGREAIRAVLNPPVTNDLFFVADGTGGHVFAETYAEHERNVVRWREIRARAEAAGEDLAGATQAAPDGQ